MKIKLTTVLFFLFSFLGFAQKVIDYKLVDLWNNSQWELYSKQSITYDNNDSVTLLLDQNWDPVSGKFLNQHRRKNVFNSNGNKIYVFDDWYRNDSIGWKNSFKDAFSYNSSGQLTEFILYLWEFSQWKPSVKVIYTYNANQQMVYADSYGWDSSNKMWKTDYKRYRQFYDSYGNLVRSEGGGYNNYYIYNVFNQLDSTYRKGFTNNQWQLISFGSYQYNSKSKLSKSFETNWDAITNKPISELIQYYKYNSDSLIVEKMFENPIYLPSPWFNKSRTRYFYKKSLNNLPFNGSLFIYPQPATTTLNFVNNVNGLTYKIFTILGSEIQSGNLRSGVNSLDVTSFKKGTYVLKVYGTNKIWTEKFLVTP